SGPGGPGGPGGLEAGFGGESEPIDLLRVAGVPVARRAAAAVGAAVVVALLVVGVRRLRRG
ncbi:hypothetical protein G3I64_11840, partial [Streptomyces sp. SID8499]|nr:hypothetical protein [Streptomyces sp. SID8499]